MFIFNDWDKPLAVAYGTFYSGYGGEFDPDCNIILEEKTLIVYSNDTKENLHVIPIEKVKKIERYSNEQNKKNEWYNPEPSRGLKILGQIILCFAGIIMLGGGRKGGNREVFLKIQYKDEDNIIQAIFFTEPQFNGIIKKFESLKEGGN